MRAIILSAGRGSRLLPLTEAKPKCLLPIAETTVLGHQLDTLAACGVGEAVVVTGFMTRRVENELAARDSKIAVTTLFNPFFQVADNLASCWMAREFMEGDFLLINGDTLFEQDLLRSVLDSPANPVQVTIDKKADYDSDDMKVTLEGSRLTAIGKKLQAHETNGESIGMLRFMGDGPERFTAKLTEMMRTGDGVSAWFLKAIDAIAKTEGVVETHSIEGRVWAEVDTLEDYEGVQALVADGNL